MPVGTLTEQECRNMLRDYVKRRGTQEEAAAKLGISQQYLSQMVNGDCRLSPRVLRKLGIYTRIVYSTE